MTTKVLQVKLSPLQHKKLKLDAVQAGETMTEYVIRKTDLLDTLTDVSNDSQSQSCMGHDSMRINCGLTGCKY